MLQVAEDKGYERCFGKTSHERVWDALKRKLLGGHLWNPSYFVATVSENTEEQIRKYIQNQKVK